MYDLTIDIDYPEHMDWVEIDDAIHCDRAAVYYWIAAEPINASHIAKINKMVADIAFTESANDALDALIDLVP